MLLLLLCYYDLGEGVGVIGWRSRPCPISVKCLSTITSHTCHNKIIPTKKETFVSWKTIFLRLWKSFSWVFKRGLVLFFPNKFFKIFIFIYFYNPVVLFLADITSRAYLKQCCLAIILQLWDPSLSKHLVTSNDSHPAEVAEWSK